MALSNPRAIYGIHSVTPYNINTGEFYGTMKVLQSSSLALTGELISLNGGSSKYPWAVEDGLITSELALSFNQYDDFLFELMLGKKPTANAAEASGSITTLTNKNGALVEATTGIASVGIKTGSEADLKFTKYVVKAVDATTVDVYAASDIDFKSGEDKSFESDLLKITATPLTITDTSGVTEVPGYGIELTGGSGTVAMTADDTATFEVRSANSESMDVVIGGAGDVFPEWGAIVVAQKRGTSEMFEIDLFRVKAVGLPIGFNTNEFSQAEITAQAFYDSNRNGIMSVRHIKPV